jgi:hypothetical protein
MKTLPTKRARDSEGECEKAKGTNERTNEAEHRRRFLRLLAFFRVQFLLHEILIYANSRLYGIGYA